MDMPIDVNGGSVQTLYPTGATNGTSSGSSATLAVPSGSVVVRIAAEQPVYIAFGDNRIKQRHLLSSGGRSVQVA